jgi:hypothetical protein
MPTAIPKMPAVATESFLLKGGLDLISPALAISPGACRDALNFECNVLGGYSRITGYERFDGRPSPSDQTYWSFQANISGAVTAGQTIVGATSGATGVVCLVDTTTIAGVTFIAFTKLTGGFASGGENLKVNGVVVARSLAAESRTGAPTAKANAIWAKAAADIYRADIQRVPGSGAILGVWMFNDVVYAFRNNVGGTAAVMWKATVAGWTQVTTPTLLPNGKYEFVNANFGGTAAMLKMFGCDGANKAFSFDGTTFTQISTGMASDIPQHIEFHKNFLWLTFAASLQHSAIGDPYTWSAVVGAAELALGDNITAIRSYIGASATSGSTSSSDAMLITTNSKTWVLYGSSNADFSLSVHSAVAGGVKDSVQVMDQPYYLSDLGLVNLQVTGAYGNFMMSSLSQQINPFVQNEHSRVTASCIARAKSQYRIYFSDGYGIYVTFLNGKIIGLMVVNIGIALRCIASLKRTNNDEVMYAGSDDGYIYQLEKGTSFDGTQIISYLNLAFAAFKTPRMRKHFRKAVLEVKGNGYLEYLMSYDLAWANADIAPTPAQNAVLALASTNWDTFFWDQFYWDGVNNAPTEIPLDGTGENIGLKLVSQADYLQPFTISSAIIHYTLRRQLR